MRWLKKRRILRTVRLLQEKRRNPSEAVEILGRLLESRDLEVARSAEKALSRIAHLLVGTVPALTQSLESQDNTERMRAISVLGSIGGRIPKVIGNAIPIIAKSLYSHDEEVRMTAILALKDIGAVAAPAIPALLCTLKVADWEVRDAAADALGSILDNVELEFGAPAGEALLDLACEEDWAEIGAAPAATIILGEPITAEVKAKHTATTEVQVHRWVKEAALASLIKLGAAAVPVLIKALSRCVVEGTNVNEAKLNRRAVIVAEVVSQLGSAASATAPGLVRMLFGTVGIAKSTQRERGSGVEIAAADALVSIGRGAVPALLRGLESADDATCRRCARILAKITGADFGSDAARWREWWQQNETE